MFGHLTAARALPRINCLCPSGNMRLLVPVTVPASIKQRRPIRLTLAGASAQAQTKIALTERSVLSATS
jgi:hypothetical protein